MRKAGLPGTLYHRAPLVIPSSKYSFGYKSLQGCPLCIRGFSCTQIPHKWELNNEFCCNRVLRPCQVTDFTKTRGFYQSSFWTPKAVIIPAWNNSNSVLLPESRLRTPAERFCHQATDCTDSFLPSHHHRGSSPPRNLNFRKPTFKICAC